jgi:N-acetylglucosamine-6-sulfatase
MTKRLSIILATITVVIAAAACYPVYPVDPGSTTTTSTTDPTGSTTTTAAPGTTTTTTGPPGATPPNILLVITDDQGCDQHNTYLCDQVQSSMHWLASQPGGSWWVSTQTRYHGSVCCPDRASTLTGQTNLHNHQYGNSDDPTWEGETLPTALQRNGYRTGLFGKYLNPYNHNGDDPPGWDRWLAQISLPSYYNFDVADGGNQSSIAYTVPKTDDTSYDAYWFRDRLIPWVDDQHAAGRPWFAYYAPYAPHEPSGAPGGITTADYSVPPSLPNKAEGCTGATDPSIADKPTFVQDNACKTAGRSNGNKAQVAVDRAIHSMYDNLAATGQLDNTIIVFMGDNGQSLNSHRITGKQCAYEECHTNPLMIRVPGTAGGHLDRIVSNIDVMPTLLALTGSSTTITMDGMNAAPLFVGDTSGWRTDNYQHNGDPAHPEVDDYDTVRQDCVVHIPCYVYTVYHDGERELYDLTADPYQLTNLLPNPTTGYAGVSGWDDSNPEIGRASGA